MITECPNCHKTISADNFGIMTCPKCGALVFIGNPLKNEENSVIDGNPRKKDGETEDQNAKIRGISYLTMSPCLPLPAQAPLR